MPRTPDRFPGSREEDEILMEAVASSPTANGAIRYKTGVGFEFFEEGAAKHLGGTDPTTADMAYVACMIGV